MKMVLAAMDDFRGMQHEFRSSITASVFREPGGLPTPKFRGGRPVSISSRDTLASTSGATTSLRIFYD